MKKKRIEYEKPAMQVYELKEPARLLQASGLGDPTDYPGGDDPFA